MKSAEDQTIEAVRLARDLCMGMGAFVVSTSGDVRFELAGPGHAGTLGERVAVLARSCLERPGAQGNEPFWNAEILGDDESADDSLACVAVPIRAGTRWSGLLGVVDTWLPELDEEQRLGLVRLTTNLGQLVASGELTLSGPGFYSKSETVKPENLPTMVPPGVPVPKPPGIGPCLRMSSYSLRLSASPRTSYAALISLKRSSEPGLASGWYCLASFR